MLYTYNLLTTEQVYNVCMHGTNLNGQIIIEFLSTRLGFEYEQEQLD